MVILYIIAACVTGTPECKIYFTTDGSKPNHMQPKVGGRETTFKYRGPFTMSSGKRTLKAIAVARYDISCPLHVMKVHRAMINHTLHIIVKFID